MRMNLSPSVYLALCGLVKDALEVPNDAEPVLHKAAVELAAAVTGPEEVPAEVTERLSEIVEMRDGALQSKKSAA
ncbi:MAG: hypothetical protein HY053_07270 [Proteobacteria bacterium]|nr:hypothetical protein [Pseudomonadota bacterium]